MSRRWQVRLGLAAVSTLCALWVGRALIPDPKLSPGLSHDDQERAAAATRALLASPLPAGGEHGPRIRLFPDSTLVREEVPPRHARILYPQIDKIAFVYDPRAVFVRAPNLRSRTPALDELIGEEAWYVTNSLGLREDGEVASEKPDLRVIVTGDSHTDGVCNNAQSFPNVLEALLAERHPDRTVEVLNAGIGGASFYQYLGQLERLLELEPDVFVVATYGGNDSIDVLKLQRYFSHATDVVVPGPAHNGRVGRAEAELGPLTQFLAQSLRQVATFRAHPEAVDTAVNVTRELTLEMERLCEREGIRLIGVYVPPMTNVQPELARPELGRVLQLLWMTADDLAVQDRLADAWLDFLRERSIPSVDLREPFRSSDEPLYWRFDHHVNVAGHRVAARALLPVVEAAVDW